MSGFLRNPFEMLFPKKMVGIDIGTSSVKLVEISRWGDGKTLENYGEISSEAMYGGKAPDPTMGGSLLAGGQVANAIRAILEEAKIKTRSAIFSIPDFSTFCTSFDIPNMPEEEIAQAITYNASQFITLPISEVTLDWQIISRPETGSGGLLKIFLVAIPNQVIQEYQALAKEAGLTLYALEAEALSIARALAAANKKTICIMDIGVQSSTVNIVDQGFLKKSYSFNFYSNQLSQAVAASLGITPEKAEEIKNQEGLTSQRQNLAQALYPLIDPLLSRVKSISAEFFQSDQKEVEEVYLTGGTANLPGLKNYFEEQLKKKVYVPNCFSGILYPPILENSLREMNPRFSAAVGAALSGLE